MSKVKIKLNPTGVRELLKSDGVTSECRTHATQAYNQISGIGGYVMEERSYPERRGYAIYAQEYPAIQDNLDNNTLLKVGKV